MQQEHIAKEARFATHIKGNDWRDDMHIVKEMVHYKDGTSKPNVSLIKNFKRPFYVTKPQYRDHKQKKEREHLSKLIKHTSTDTDLRNSVASALGKRYMRGSLRMLSSDPYLYGSDTSAASIIKYMYSKKYPEYNSPYTYATLDIETDVLDRYPGEVIIESTAMGKKVHISILKDFLGDIANPIERLNQCARKYLGKYLDAGLEIVFDLCNSEGEVISNPIVVTHEWKPDFLGVWNISFDFSKIMEAAERNGIQLKHLFADPAVPNSHREFKFNRGKSKKTTISGVTHSLAPSEQWHTVTCSASFFPIDAMSTYRAVRSQEQKEPSYSLDAILKKELGERKLKFEEANHLSGLAWHEFMQDKYPIEYCIYNVFDSYSMIELDKKTMDMSVRVPTELEYSSFRDIPTRTKRTDDITYFSLLEDNYISGTVPDMDSEEVDRSLPLSGWVVTLPAYKCVNNGARCVLEDPYWNTNIHIHNTDSDIISSYPFQIKCLNISKGTTTREVIDIRNVAAGDFKMHNINFMHGPVNAVDYCVGMFGYPTLDNLLKRVANDHTAHMDRAA